MRFWVLLIAALSWIAPGSAKAGVSDWAPFAISDGIITVDLTVDGRPARAMLVTTTNYSVIDEQFLASHPSPLGTSGQETDETDGFSRQGFIDDVPVTLFGTHLNLQRVTYGKLGRADLLLGLGFFNCCIVQIDYPGQRMRLLDRDAMPALEEAANVKMRRDPKTRMPLVQAKLDGEYESWLTLNTGGATGGLLLNRDVAVDRGWLDKYPTEQSSGQKLSGNGVSFQSFQMPELQFGPVDLANVKVSVMTDAGVGKKDRKKPGQADGFLGYDVLKHFIVTIDYSREIMHIALPPEQ